MCACARARCSRSLLTRCNYIVRCQRSLRAHIFMLLTCTHTHTPHTHTHTHTHTAGQERFNSMHPSYYHGAHACIMCFDITRKITYTNLSKWWQELQVFFPLLFSLPPPQYHRHLALQVMAGTPVLCPCLFLFFVSNRSKWCVEQQVSLCPTVSRYVSVLMWQLANVTVTDP